MVAGYAPSGALVLRYAVEEDPEWFLEDEDVPETTLHDRVLELLVLVLRRWVAATGRDALVARNLGCRWKPSDARVGMDPDVCLIEPRPPGAEALTTLRVWEPGHAPPRLAVEVVSEDSGDKDYANAPLRAARLGIEELWVFDPLGVGSKTMGGPFPLQVWRREDGEVPGMARVYAGDGPAFSPALGAWAVLTEGGRRLRVADDPPGRALWPTEAEAEGHRAEAESRRAEAESRRAEAESRRAEAESRRAEAESRRAEEAIRRAEAVEAELRRLRSDGDG